MSLHEKYLPQYDFNEVHRIEVKAPADRIFEAIMDLDVRKSRLIRILIGLRGMKPEDSGGFQNLQKMGFTILEVMPMHEGIAGLVGQFWKPSGNIQKLSAEEFVSFAREGFLKATWNFRITASGEGSHTVETETRVQCIGPLARKKFRRYWLLVKPFSGIIRKEMLKIIRHQAGHG